MRSIRDMLKRIASELKQQFHTPKRAFIIGIALLLLVIGIIGFLIPFIPGFIFWAPSVLLISIYSPTAYQFLKRKVSGHPKAESIIDRIRNWVINRLHSSK